MSKFKVGDRCEILYIKHNNDGSPEWQPGAIVTVFALYDMAAHLPPYADITVQLPSGELAFPESKQLRKIDDDHDEIPADIRAIFDDKCDETLPRPERMVK